MYTNIRSLNSNFEKLQILIKSLKIKPYIIVCTETNILDRYEYFKLRGYKSYYNNSKVNKSDSVVVYIKENVTQVTETIVMDNIKILNSYITLQNNSKLEISSLYRSHDISQINFNYNLNKYLILKKKVGNHFVIGDFNTDILKDDLISNDFLNNFLDKGYYHGFIGTTRPYDLNTERGTCIDNIFVKTKTIMTKTYKLRNPITDHYPLFIQINRKNRYNTEKSAVVTHKYNYNKLSSIASAIDRSIHNSENNPNIAINFMIKEIQNCLDRSRYICSKKD